MSARAPWPDRIDHGTVIVRPWPDHPSSEAPAGDARGTRWVRCATGDATRSRATRPGRGAASVPRDSGDPWRRPRCALLTHRTLVIARAWPQQRRPEAFGRRRGDHRPVSRARGAGIEVPLDAVGHSASLEGGRELGRRCSGLASTGQDTVSCRVDRERCVQDILSCSDGASCRLSHFGLTQ